MIQQHGTATGFPDSAFRYDGVTCVFSISVRGMYSI